MEHTLLHIMGNWVLHTPHAVGAACIQCCILHASSVVLLHASSVWSQEAERSVATTIQRHMKAAFAHAQGSRSAQSGPKDALHKWPRRLRCVTLPAGALNSCPSRISAWAQTRHKTGALPRCSLATMCVCVCPCVQAGCMPMPKMNCLMSGKCKWPHSHPQTNSQQTTCPGLHSTILARVDCAKPVRSWSASCMPKTAWHAGYTILPARCLCLRECAGKREEAQAGG